MALAREWHHLLAGCDASQSLAITCDDHPLLIVAGAGSGKTRVLTRRIARRIADESAHPARVLALTFTRKAAGELRGRLRALGLPVPVTAGTFHAVALGELRRRHADLGLAPPVVLDSKVRLLARVLPDRYAVDGGGRSGRTAGRGDVLSALASEIEWAKARCIAPDRYQAASLAEDRIPVLDRDLVAQVYASYEREKSKRKVLDFDDLLLGLAEAIESDADFAASQRWLYRHLFVDELQDASAAQLRLLGAWLGGRDDICAVGDPRQAIYGWNGADSGALAGFPDRHPGATILHLDANYRSTPQIVAVASAALAREECPVARTERPDGRIPTVTACATAEEEVARVVEEIRRAHGPARRWSDLAVLARTNAQLVAFEIALARADVPVSSGAGSAFLGRPAVRAALEAVADSRSSAAFFALLDDLRLQLRSDDPTTHFLSPSLLARPIGGELVDDPSARTLPALTPDTVGDLEALERLGRDYCQVEVSPTTDGFVSWARAALRSDLAPTERDAVMLCTFHRAKGLEWPIVFVCGLEEGYVPISQAHSDDALAEERRLLYVALSRASDELHCSWAQSRTFGSRRVAREPSRHLLAIESARDTLVRLATPDRATARRAIAAGRALLDRPAAG